MTNNKRSSRGLVSIRYKKPEPFTNSSSESDSSSCVIGSVVLGVLVLIVVLLILYNAFIKNAKT